MWPQIDSCANSASALWMKVTGPVACGTTPVRTCRSASTVPAPVTRPAATADTEHGVMYESLRTNIPKEVMALPELRFDPRLPSFITHRDALAYILEFKRRTVEQAAAGGFEMAMDLNTTVSRVAPATPGAADTKWRVTTKPVASDDDGRQQHGGKRAPGARARVHPCVAAQLPAVRCSMTMWWWQMGTTTRHVPPRSRTSTTLTVWYPTALVIARQRALLASVSP